MNRMLGGQWETFYLVALEMNWMFKGQWGNILFSGQWKVPSLVALWMFHVWLPLEGEGKTSFLFPSIFHLIKFYLYLFPIDFKVLFYHGSKPLLHIFLHFPWPINYNHAFRITKSSTHLTPNWLKIEDLFLFFNSWHCAQLRFMGLKLHKWTKNRLESHP